MRFVVQNNAPVSGAVSASAPVGCSALLGPDDVATIRRWARQIGMMADTFLDERAEKCRMASRLLFEITTQNAQHHAEPTKEAIA